MSSTTHAFLQHLNADTTSPSTNINTQGCNQRQQHGTNLACLALFLTLLFKLTGPKTKAWYGPISFLYTAATASVAEAQLQTCLLVAALDTTSRSDIVRLKTILILTLSILVQVLSYCALGYNEPGRWCPMVPSSLAQHVCCYVPNLLGYVRLLLLLGATAFVTTSPLVFVVLWALSCGLDFFDGYLARRLAQTSRLGELLDVVTDNMSRTTMWCAAVSVQGTPLGVAMLVSALEWCTMLSTQLMSNQTNWKKDVVQAEEEEEEEQQEQQQQQRESPPPPPWFVRAFFSHNFLNPLGVLGIGGLFGLPLWLYVEGVGLWPHHEAWHATVLSVLVLGRSIAGILEVYLCRQYLVQRVFPVGPA
jgi:hypothetical protein